MSITSSHSHSRGGSYGSQFGDTTLTKVFVGGLAWETPRDSLREHFEKYGEILEAVIIYDKITGRSKGYGFVTFKEAEAAEKACEDNAPMINGRKANCNLASLGAKRDKPVVTPALSSTPSRSPPPQTVAINTIPPAGLRSTVPNIPGSANGVRWYYPALRQQAVPYYGYSPAPTAYMNYNQKMGGLYNVGGGFYSNGNGQVYHQVAVAAAAAAGVHQMMPMYPFFYHQQQQQMSFPAHIFPAMHRVPALVPKPTAFVVPPNPAGAMVGV